MTCMELGTNGHKKTPPSIKTRRGLDFAFASDLELIHRCDLVGLNIGEVEAHFELVATDQADGLFFGQAVVGNLDFVVIPSFPNLELFGAVDPEGSVALGGVIGKHHLGTFRNVQSQGCFDRIVAGGWVKKNRLGATCFGDDRLGLANFFPFDFVDSLDFESISFRWAQVFADELPRGTGCLGRISIDEYFGIQWHIDG